MCVEYTNLQASSVLVNVTLPRVLEKYLNSKATGPESLTDGIMQAAVLNASLLSAPTSNPSKTQLGVPSEARKQGSDIVKETVLPPTT